MKQLPLKSRVARNTGKHKEKSIVYVSSDVKTEFYLATDKVVKPIDFLEAIKYLDEYIQMKGAKYKDHNLTLRKWVFDAVKRDKSKGKPSEGSILDAWARA